MQRWPALATEGAAVYGYDWSKLIPSGASLSSVSYALDPSDSNIAFSSAAVASNVATVKLTAGTTEGTYIVKMSPTLSVGNISPLSVEIKVVKHKPG